MENIEFLKGGSAYICSKIEEALTDQSRTATISGNWEIDEAIRLPSNFTLILKNAHLRMADGVGADKYLAGITRRMNAVVVVVGAVILRVLRVK